MLQVCLGNIEGTTAVYNTTFGGGNVTYHYDDCDCQLQGWRCPNCGAINAPWLSHCPCGGVYVQPYYIYPFYLRPYVLPMIYPYVPTEPILPWWLLQ